MSEYVAEKHQCDVCGRPYLHRAGLNRHRRKTGHLSNEVERVCPHCGLRYAGDRALAIHVSVSHGVSGLTKVRVTCVQCGKEKKEPRRSLMRVKRFFCSTRCRSAWDRGHNTGSANPSWKGGGVKVSCARCGREFSVPQRRASKARYCSQECRFPNGRSREVFCMTCGRSTIKAPHDDGRFCSNRCAAASKRKNRVQHICKQCGRAYEMHQCHSRRGDGVFCSKGCHNTWMSEHQVLEHNPNWQGGGSNERAIWQQNGGRKWRRTCRKRDGYECQRCGAKFDPRSESLQVHHKAGFAKYPALRSVVDNGISLCKSCHEWVTSRLGDQVRVAWEAEAVACLSPQDAVVG